MVSLLENNPNLAMRVPSPAVPIPDSQQIANIMVLKFWTEYKADGTEEDWVMWVKKGENAGTTTNEAIKRLAPNPNTVPPRRAALEWSVIAPAYQAWKAGETIPVDGTPLHAWAGVPREMVEQLKKFNIYTIEDLAQFPDHQMSKIPLAPLRAWKEKAKAWVEAAETSDIGNKLAERDARLDALKGDNEALKLQLDELRQMMSNNAPQTVNQAIPVGGPAPSEDDDVVLDIPGRDDVSPATPPRSKMKR